MMRTIPLILLAALSSACSPAFDFLVYNASAATVEVFGYETRCTAAPRTACAASGGTLRVVRGDRAMVFQPHAFDLFRVSESRLSAPRLVRLRFDGDRLLVVAPKDESWTALAEQPRGFPLPPQDDRR